MSSNSTQRSLRGPWRWIVWFGLALFGFRAAAVELLAPPSVTPTPTNAILRWQTDTTAGSRVQYGTRLNALDQRAEGSVGTEHEVVLSGLKPGTTYYFAVGTARLRLATNSFVTPSLGSAGSVAPPPTNPPSATSASGNKSGTAAASQPLPKPPPTRETWGSPRTLQDHFDRHGRDFQARDPDDYAAQAWLFLQRAKRDGLPAKRDAEGVLRVFDPKTRAFAAYNRDGTTKTYFKPGRRDYFEDQPGDPVDLRATGKDRGN